MVWCGVVWCGVVWCGAWAGLGCRVVWCGIVSCSVVLCCVRPCYALFLFFWHCVVLRPAVLCFAALCCAVSSRLALRCVALRCVVPCRVVLRCAALCCTVRCSVAVWRRAVCCVTSPCRAPRRGARVQSDTAQPQPGPHATPAVSLHPDTAVPPQHRHSASSPARRRDRSCPGSRGWGRRPCPAS